MVSTAANKKVALIVPYPATRYKNSSGVWVTDNLLGGIMTAGGLNYWDDWGDDSGLLYTQGSYAVFKNYLGPGFNRIALSDYCKLSMSNNHVDIFYSHDIMNYTVASNPYRITSVTISPISRSTTGDNKDDIVWSDTATQIILNGTMFIDASTDGRLARRINTACTVGRYDWPTTYLPGDEDPVNSGFVGRQQAATLMIKMRLPNPPTAGIDTYPSNPNKAAALWTSSNQYANPSGLIFDFNQTYQDSHHIMIKPTNAARDGINSDEWWVNGLLVFNVDGRAHQRDIDEDTIFKVNLTNPNYSYRTTDAAWTAARKFIKCKKSIIEDAFGTFAGFSGCEIVLDDNGDPVVGDILYIRETVHMSGVSTARAHNSEENYHISKSEAQNAGTSSTTGSDTGNYPYRIGVTRYNCDLHPYQPSDLINSSGVYVWGEPAAQNMRSDASDPLHPVYIPYGAIVTNYVANLLIPGYAACVSSYAWGEIRVFSSLSVLGDAAGITAGYCCNNNIYAHLLANNSTHMQAIQTKILAVGGRLEK